MIVPILSLVTFLPLGGALLLIFFPAERTRMVRFFALGVAVLTFLLSLALYFGFDSGISSPQFVEQRAWIG
ncbi:MAG: Fe-S-binding domain-containing protein, partial [Candidatus Aminicenantes bacterium]|nr:Fe-S-binding domain-containing protein [Candidatus Aminicenantes bacterium]